MEHIKQTFAQCAHEKRPSLVTYVTAGFPTAAETVDILLDMEAGGADLIDLGLPFTDPIADGAIIQRANTQTLKNGITASSTLSTVRYGEEQILQDAKDASVNGFTVVDLPPEETVTNGVVKHQKEEKKPKTNRYHLENGHGETEKPVHADEIIKPGQNGSGPGLATQLEALNMDSGDIAAVPSRFGEFGGQYVPESLMDCLAELEEGFNKAKNDPKFWEEYGHTTLVAVEAGTITLRDAVNEAMRAWLVDLPTTYYIIGSAIGPHPFPTIVRTFQSVIGNETKEQMQSLRGKLPDAVVTCVGGGSKVAGMFYPFAEDPSVKLLGVEAGGEVLNTDRHSATLTGGSKGVLHCVRMYVLQNKHGQISETHSVSAGLDYPGVEPELSSWKDNERAKLIAATEAEAFKGFRLL
ncbi:MAG: hypothetical protein Q9164_002936 [Protoblastenia rupestris]